MPVFDLAEASLVGSTQLFTISVSEQGPAGETFPSQTGNSGKYLSTDGSAVSWQTVVGGTGSWGAITGTLSAQTDLQSALDAKAAKASNLSDLASVPTARTNLGLGTLATQSGTFSGTSSGANTGDQTSIVGITGTKAQFDTACTDGDFAYQSNFGTGVGTALTIALNGNNGICGLDGTGKVAAAQLPSYVDDVIEFANLATFPVTGTTGLIYVAIDTTKIYRWSGSAYVELSPSTAVWGSISGTLSNQTDLQSAIDAKQPLDADLTAIAALATTSSGRSLLTVAGTTGTGNAVLSTSPTLNGPVTINGTTTAYGVVVSDGPGQGKVTLSPGTALATGSINWIKEDGIRSVYLGQDTYDNLTLTFDLGGSFLVDGNIFASNLSGTNTGDQNLSSYATTAYVVAGYIPLATSVTNRLPKRNGTTGALTDSGITVDASNNVTGVAAITASGAVTSTPTAVAASGMVFGVVENGTEKFGYRSGGANGELYVASVSPHGQSIAIRPRSNASGGNAILSSSGAVAIRNSADNADVNLTAAAITASGDLACLTAGKGLQLKAGTNARGGNATLIAGTITVTNTTVSANTVITLTRKTSGGTIGTSITYTLSAGASFTINSDNLLDTSTFSYLLLEVNP